MSEKNWFYAAGIVWPLLVDAASKRAKLSYSEIAPHIGTNPLSVGRALSPIQDYCLDSRLPPLTSIVVGKTTDRPGSGFIAWDVDDIDTAYKLVYDFNWNGIQNPYSGFGPTDTIDTLAEALVAEPDKCRDVYTRVRVRGVAQVVFRKALLEAYGNKCAICGLTFRDALEASHIVPWQSATKAQRLDPRNGILLCSLHHKLFDAGLITVSGSMTIVYYDPIMKDHSYSAIDKSLTVDLHGRMISLPMKKELMPDVALLDVRNSQHGWIKSDSNLEMSKAPR